MAQKKVSKTFHIDLDKQELFEEMQKAIQSYLEEKLDGGYSKLADELSTFLEDIEQALDAHLEAFLEEDCGLLYNETPDTSVVSIVYNEGKEEFTIDLVATLLEEEKSPEETDLSSLTSTLNDLGLSVSDKLAILSIVEKAGVK